MTLLPNPESVVAAHRSLLRLTVEAIRRGTIHAQEYADWMDEQIDRALAPAHVRKGARRYLSAANQNVQNEEEIDYETEFLSNLGLSMSAPGIQMRILRSANNDQLPVPGHSHARQAFYQQSFDIAEDTLPATADQPIIRLVLHWSTDAEYNLDRVYLGCPKTGALTRESTTSHWDWPIWRRHGLAIDGQVQAEVSELDIYLDIPSTGTGAE